MKKTYRFLLAASLVLALAFTLSCSSVSEDNHAESYYVEAGSVSVYAYEWFNSNPGVNAYDVLQIINQFPVVPDPYKDAQRGVSREELEAELNYDIPGYSKEQFLRMLDTTGAVIQFFIMENGDYVYIFVEKEL